MSQYVPIFDYTNKGKQISVADLPKNTYYRFDNSVGGGALDKPVVFNTVMPNGRVAHGGSYVVYQGTPYVGYH